MLSRVLGQSCHGNDARVLKAWLVPQVPREVVPFVVRQSYGHAARPLTVNSQSWPIIERVLAEFLASWTETSAPMPQTWAEASAKLRPYVRPLDYFALAALHLELQGKPPRSLPRCVRPDEAQLTRLKAKAVLRSRLRGRRPVRHYSSMFYTAQNFVRAGCSVSVMSGGSPTSRTLNRAVAICGGVPALAAALGVSIGELSHWLEGKVHPPTDIYIMALDLVAGGRDTGR
jgi:hypothetical protein